MLSLRLSTGAAVLLAVAASWLVVGPAFAADEAEALQQAIRLFEDGDYLFAQEILAKIDRSKLSSAQQARRDEPESGPGGPTNVGKGQR